MITASEQLRLANSHFIGRTGLLEVISESDADASADVTLLEPTVKVRKRRFKKLLPPTVATTQVITPAPAPLPAEPDTPAPTRPITRRRG